MKATSISLRLLVLIGCFVLLFSRARESESQPVCETWRSESVTCPPGCTVSKFTNYYEVGSGQNSAPSITDPCGTAKQGQTCTQPTNAYGADSYNSACCVEEYLTCANPPRAQLGLLRRVEVHHRDRGMWGVSRCGGRLRVTRRLLHQLMHKRYLLQ
jgi:hypothetical protein